MYVTFEERTIAEVIRSFWPCLDKLLSGFQSIFPCYRTDILQFFLRFSPSISGVSFFQGLPSFRFITFICRLLFKSVRFLFLWLDHFHLFWIHFLFYLNLLSFFIRYYVFLFSVLFQATFFSFFSFEQFSFFEISFKSVFLSLLCFSLFFS